MIHLSEALHTPTTLDYSYRYQRSHVSLFEYAKVESLISHATAL